MPLLLKRTELNRCESETPTPNVRWYFVFFVISGFCGLVYEVVWLRLAMASFGVTTALASIVISMFMAGLGLGSWAAGRLTRRILDGDGPRALRFYSIAELLVGISALAVPLQLKLGRLLLQQMGSFGAWQTSRYYLLAGLWIAITLIPWCTCMGSTFPLLMAVIRQTARPTSERSFSYLYVANVLGALLGTLASAFVLIELLGFQGTLYVAGTLNTILALLAFRMSFRTLSSPSIEKCDLWTSDSGRDSMDFQGVLFYSSCSQPGWSVWVWKSSGSASSLPTSVTSSMRSHRSWPRTCSPLLWDRRTTAPGPTLTGPARALRHGVYSRCLP